MALVGATDRQNSATKGRGMSDMGYRESLLNDSASDSLGVHPEEREATAIIGMACRLPGDVRTLEDYWKLLVSGQDAISTTDGRLGPIFPEKVFEDARTAGVRWGGFLGGVDCFDANFFGISAAEARLMDPQQRILMEVAWEALEQAGIDPAQLEAQRVGIFVGSFGQDYELLQARDVEVDQIGAHFGSGVSRSMLAGRLAYRLGTRGPAMMVDTACSSSLVALHLAAQSLRRRECELAIVGGVNLILAPEPSISYARAGMLSADGRCKTFSAAADGYVRSEGCGVVVLRRHSDAKRVGERALALVRGSAVNQDGASNGLTAPNGVAQEEVIESALADAGLTPAQISFVEAHGTGTPLGDVVEANALAAVYGRGRNCERPLILASGKTNIGHAEAASGIAGLIKTVLSLSYRVIPPHLLHGKVNPAIDLASIPAVLPAVPMAWATEADAPRIAGINSFGFSGTNAHVIVEEAPSAEPRPTSPRSARVFCISAPNQRGLAALAKRHLSFLQENVDLDLDDYCFSINAGRRRFSHRFAAAVTSTQTLQRALKDVAIDRPVGDYFVGKARQPRIGFVFSGQGSQRLHMARELLETQPVARQAFEACSSAMSPILGVSVADIIAGKSGAVTDIDNTRYAQPALFALQYALTCMWRDWGVEPVAVLGHSVGEFAAACAAGVLNLEAAAALVVTRGAMMAVLPAGAMLALAAGEAEAREILLEVGDDQTALAALNGPRSTVISGPVEAIRRAQAFASSGMIPSTLLAVSHAFHSPMMTPMQLPFEAEVRMADLSKPGIPFFSTVTGAGEAQRLTSADYWSEQIVAPVRFCDAMTGMLTCTDVLIEIGPDATLSGMAKALDDGMARLWLPSLARGREDWRVISESLANLEVAGATLAWDRIDGPHSARRVPTPTYPFQMQSYWYTDRKEARMRPGAAADESRVPVLTDRPFPTTASASELLSVALNVEPTDPDASAAQPACLVTAPERVTESAQLVERPVAAEVVTTPLVSPTVSGAPSPLVPTVGSTIAMPHIDRATLHRVASQAIAKLLEVQIEDIEFSQSLVELGIDSFLAMKLGDAIFEVCGVDLDLGLLLERFTLDELVDAVELQLQGEVGASSGDVVLTQPLSVDGWAELPGADQQRRLASMSEAELDAMLHVLSENGR